MPPWSVATGSWPASTAASACTSASRASTPTWPGPSCARWPRAPPSPPTAFGPDAGAGAEPGPERRVAAPAGGHSSRTGWLVLSSAGELGRARHRRGGLGGRLHAEAEGPVEPDRDPTLGDRRGRLLGRGGRLGRGRLLGRRRAGRRLAARRRLVAQRGGLDGVLTRVEVLGQADGGEVV